MDQNMYMKALRYKGYSEIDECIDKDPLFNKLFDALETNKFEIISDKRIIVALGIVEEKVLMQGDLEKYPKMYAEIFNRVSIAAQTIPNYIELDSEEKYKIGMGIIIDVVEELF